MWPQHGTNGTFVRAARWRNSMVHLCAGGLRTVARESGAGNVFYSQGSSRLPLLDLGSGDLGGEGPFC
jgi:hypothetical protein